MESFATDQPPRRRAFAAMLLGARLRCPNCGGKGLFGRYLKVTDECPQCGEELHHHRADDAPPYFTIFIVGKLLVPLVLVVERVWAPPLALQVPVWVILALMLTLIFLPMVKGAIVALQWALHMHGFEHAAYARANADARNRHRPDSRAGLD